MSSFASESRRKLVAVGTSSLTYRVLFAVAGVVCVVVAGAIMRQRIASYDPKKTSPPPQHKVATVSGVLAASSMVAAFYYRMRGDSQTTNQACRSKLTQTYGLLSVGLGALTGVLGTQQAYRDMTIAIPTEFVLLFAAIQAMQMYKLTGLLTQSSSSSAAANASKTTSRNPFGESESDSGVEMPSWPPGRF